MSSGLPQFHKTISNLGSLHSPALKRAMSKTPAPGKRFPKPRDYGLISLSLIGAFKVREGWPNSIGWFKRCAN